MDPEIKVDVGVKAEVPADVVRQQSDALNDALSPFVQGLGYVGDKIRFIRFQSAMKMLARAKEIAAADGPQIKTPPLKFLIPLIEDASLEDEDSPLTDMWARLLLKASDAREVEPKLHLYRSFLRQIGSNELRSLERSWHVLSSLVTAMLDRPGGPSDDRIQEFVARAQKQLVHDKETQILKQLEFMYQRIMDTLRRDLGWLLEFYISSFEHADTPEQIGGPLSMGMQEVLENLGISPVEAVLKANGRLLWELVGPGSDLNGAGWASGSSNQLLRHLGLMRDVSIFAEGRTFHTDIVKFKFIFLVPSPLGLDFMQVCKLRIAENVQR